MNENLNILLGDITSLDVDIIVNIVHQVFISIKDTSVEISMR